MSPIVKLKIDCVRAIREENEYETKFRFAVGFVGFIPLRNEPNKRLEAIFQDLENKGYYSKNNVTTLYHIFSVFEMHECTKLVDDYMRAHAPLAGIAPIVQPAEPKMSIEITDEYTYEIRDVINIGKLEELAVIGFKILIVRYNNLIHGLLPGDQTLAVLQEWKQTAPLPGIQSTIPPYNKRGLKKALDDAGVRDAIMALKLHQL